MGQLLSVLEAEKVTIGQPGAWSRWLGVAAGCTGLSVEQALLVTARVRANPHLRISHLLEYDAWPASGRQVRRGEKGIPLLAWSGDQGGPENATGVSHVFDVSQTEPLNGPGEVAAPVPDRPVYASLGELATDLSAVVASRGWRVAGTSSAAGGDGVDGAGEVDWAGEVDVDYETRTVRLASSVGDARAVVALSGVLAALWTTGEEGALEPAQAVLDAIVGQSIAVGLTHTYNLQLGQSWMGFPPAEVWAPQWQTLRHVGDTVLGTQHWITHELGELDFPGRRPVRPGPPTPGVTPAHVRSQPAAQAVTGAVQESRPSAPVSSPAGSLPHRGSSVERMARQDSSDGRVGAGVTSTLAHPASSPECADLLAIHETATAFYTEQLAGSWAEQELTDRFGPRDLRGWRPGYAPDTANALLDHLRRQGFTQAAIAESGLVRRARSGALVDRFRDRVMLPICDPDGHPIAFVGRHCRRRDTTSSPKYLNSPNTPLYSKSAHLFGLAQAAPALQTGARAVVVEGPLDAMAVTLACGVRAVGVASLGTALAPGHLDALHRVAGAGLEITVGMDPDPAGQRGALRAFGVLAAGRITSTGLQLPQGHDPDEFIRLRGAQAFLDALTAAPPLAHLLIDQRMAELGENPDIAEKLLMARACVDDIILRLPPTMGRGDDGRYTRAYDHLQAVTGLLPETIVQIALDAIPDDVPARDPPAVSTASTASTAARTAPQNNPRSYLLAPRLRTGPTPPVGSAPNSPGSVGTGAPVRRR